MIKHLFLIILELQLIFNGVLSERNSNETIKKGLLPEKCGSILEDRIVGGRKAKLYEFPWMALISYNTRHGLEFRCGGSIINSKYILTSAHCVVNQHIAGVRVGEYDISTGTDCDYDTEKVICEDHIQDLFVKDKIPHENYQRVPTRNDIALLRVDGEIFFNYSNVDPICLPISSSLRNNVLDDKEGTIAGWGYTGTGRASEVLSKVDVLMETPAVCEVEKKQLCAGKLNKSSCYGDSGGPLMIKENYNGVNSYVQYGIVSHGPLQCDSVFPGVYTDVREYVDWILDNIKE